MSDYTPPPPPQAPTASSWGTSESPTGGKGFFGALFDFSFTTFVTPRIVKVVYVLATVAMAVGFLIFLVTAFADNVGSGIVVLLIGPVVAILYLALIRMTLEFYFAIVRMSEDIHRRP